MVRKVNSPGEDADDNDGQDNPLLHSVVYIRGKMGLLHKRLQSEIKKAKATLHEKEKRLVYLQDLMQQLNRIDTKSEDAAAEILLIRRAMGL